MDFTMRRMLLSAIVLAMVMSAISCGSGSDSDSVGGESGERTIKMSVPDYMQYHMAYVAGEFKKIRPDVTIEFSVYDLYVGDYIGNWVRQAEKARLPYMTGKASPDDDDIVEAKFFSPLEHKGWMFVDLFEMMENDADFELGDYYANVFDALAVNGKLYQFPLDIQYKFAGINSDAPKEIIEKFKQYDAITYSELLDLYFSIPAKEGRYCSQYIDASTVYNSNLYAFIDFENRTNEIDSPRFIELISKAKNATDPEKVSKSQIGTTLVWSGFMQEADIKEYAARYFFAVAYNTNYQSFIPQDGEEAFAHFIPLLTECGRVEIESGSERWSISANSGNKDIAWEFIKFMASPEANMERMEDVYQAQFVANREFFRLRMPISIASYAKMFARQYDAPFHSFMDDLEGNTGRIVEMFDRYNMMPMVDIAWGSMPIDTGEIFRAYHSGSMTAEQVASELHNKVSIILIE